MYIELKTEHLLIRSMQIQDAESTYLYQGDKELTKYMLFLPDESLEATREFIQGIEEEQACPNPRRFEMVIFLGQKHIGGISIYLEEDDGETVGELGWILRKEYQGNGYIVEAAKAVMDFAFENLPIKKIIAHCDQRNIASKRVMEKLEMFLEKEQTRFYKKRNEPAREYKYSIFHKN